VYKRTVLTCSTGVMNARVRATIWTFESRLSGCASMNSITLCNYFALKNRKIQIDQRDGAFHVKFVNERSAFNSFKIYVGQNSLAGRV
jgi:hypothetical protein